MFRGEMLGTFIGGGGSLMSLLRNPNSTGSDDTWMATPGTGYGLLYIIEVGVGIFLI